MSRILMVSSEAAPFAKTGGLSDVLGALPGALRQLGHAVAVLLPRYAQTKPFAMRRIWGDLAVRMGPRTYVCDLFQSEQDPTYLFLGFPEFYDRPGLYNDELGDYPDNYLRFGLLGRAALEVIRHIFGAQILHCHDWQAGLGPLYARLMPGDPTFAGIRTLFTIHNLGYQGLFPASVLPELGLPASVFRPDGLEFYGKAGFLKAGLQYADSLSTVSARYAEEIQTPEYGSGLDGLLRRRARDLHGILNGVDYERWNPATDPFIAANYSVADVSGKAECKRALLKEFGLPDTAFAEPLIGIVSRFTSQKGADLIAAAGDRLFEEKVNMVALGSGERVYEAMFTGLAEKYAERVGVRIGFDEALAHRIEAGADMFLMPSRYEPSGLNQLYSLRYGTVPVVRATGGLDDTVDESTGFKFADYLPEAMLASVREAIVAYANPVRWRTMMRIGMSRDHSWAASARQYSALYSTLLNPVKG
jgi:starch synthase